MLAKLLIIVIFLGIVASLGSGLMYMIRDRDSERLAKALTVRVAISVGLFASLYLLWWLGLITPHGFG